MPKPFSAEGASRRVAGRKASVNQAVESTQTRGTPSPATPSTSGRPKAQDMGGAPRATTRRSFGAPIGASGLQRMRDGQTTDNSQ